MRFGRPILYGTLLVRYKRFLADVLLDSGQRLTVHCPNPGSMATCADPGSRVIITDHGDATSRKLRHTWEAIRIGRTWVGVNTMNPNRVVEEAIARRRVPELDGYGVVRREVRYGRGMGSRIDLLLEERGRPDCYVEVKNATLRVGDGALFPDSVTERGRRHLEELACVARQGLRAVMFFFVGRSDCRFVGPAEHIDPDYARTLRRVAACGVEVLGYRGHVSAAGLRLGPRLPVVL